MRKRKTASSAAEPVTATEISRYITREMRSLMVQAQNNKRRLEQLFWFSARLGAGINQLTEHIRKLEGMQR